MIALTVVPGITPADLQPVADRPGTTVRYHIDEHRTPCLRAVLTHPAETVVRRPHFAKEAPMNTATLVRVHLPKFHGVAALYRLDPPLEGHEHVVVSAMERAPHYDPKAGGTASHNETFIFAADADGVPERNMAELPGSTTGTLDHREVLLGAGYEVTA